MQCERCASMRNLVAMSSIALVVQIDAQQPDMSDEQSMRDLFIKRLMNVGLDIPDIPRADDPDREEKLNRLRAAQKEQRRRMESIKAMQEEKEKSEKWKNDRDELEDILIMREFQKMRKTRPPQQPPQQPLPLPQPMLVQGQNPMQGAGIQPFYRIENDLKKEIEEAEKEEGKKFEEDEDELRETVGNLPLETFQQYLHDKISPSPEPHPAVKEIHDSIDRKPSEETLEQLEKIFGDGKWWKAIFDDPPADKASEASAMSPEEKVLRARDQAEEAAADARKALQQVHAAKAASSGTPTDTAFLNNALQRAQAAAALAKEAQQKAQAAAAESAALEETYRMRKEAEQQAQNARTASPFLKGFFVRNQNPPEMALGSSNVMHAQTSLSMIVFAGAAITYTSLSCGYNGFVIRNQPLLHHPYI
eukprot:gnl/MRDRNA2_/MRDRNA2_27997_c0_seq1.p1 gnl/MRDRNA2_/MRDRNA2_27997_c0~~gnl/MRDRNA2_/MRDRNA2_27997_c0_seq1.p1  ORF type:complete len:420 (-),score=111.10 gnl/MRDRNA2_/MRDRNA2_27997_c0_seq1:93-1352(-)